MRIVGGRHRGRRLVAPPGQGTRPTSDRVREALFNILAHADFAGGAPAGMTVLDLFAGSGALGLEALSRGAAGVTFVERDAATARAIEANVAALDEGGRAAVLRRDATHLGAAPEMAPFQLVLMDAPYRSGLAGPALGELSARGWLAPGVLVVIELAAKEPLVLPDGFDCCDERRYGAARIVFAHGANAAPCG